MSVLHRGKSTAELSSPCEVTTARDLASAPVPQTSSVTDEKFSIGELLLPLFVCSFFVSDFQLIWFSRLLLSISGSGVGTSKTTFDKDRLHRGFVVPALRHPGQRAPEYPVHSSAQTNASLPLHMGIRPGLWNYLHRHGNNIAVKLTELNC